MQMTSRSFVVTVAAGCWFLAACRSGTVPNQVLTKPAPVSVPVPAAHTNALWLYRPSSQRQSFVVDQHATIVIRQDTVTRTDTVSSHAEVVFTSTSSAVSGNVNAFLVTSAGHAAATPSGLTIPFSVHAGYSARTLQLDFDAPRDVSTCSSTALTVAQSFRDLWFRPADTLRVGTTWEDSSSYTVCRDGIPLRATAHRMFRVTGSVERDGRTLLEISRMARTAIDGNGAQFGEAITVSGTGSGQLVYDFDPASGEVTSASGTATLDLSMRSRARTQTVRQTAEIRIGRS